MGKTCRILSDDRVFNALETLIHQHVATVIRTRYDIAKKAGTHDRILTFLIDRYNKHKDKLGNNPRIGMMYNIWRKMNVDTQKELLTQADYYLKHLNEL